MNQDVESAATIAHNIRRDRPGDMPPPSFLRVLHDDLPAQQRWAFEDKMKRLEKISEYSALPQFYELIRKYSDVKGQWFMATEEMKKPGYKGLVVVWYALDRKPKKAKASSIQRIDLDRGMYKLVTEVGLPREVRERFSERLDDK